MSGNGSETMTSCPYQIVKEILGLGTLLNPRFCSIDGKRTLLPDNLGADAKFLHPVGYPWDMFKANSKSALIC